VVSRDWSLKKSWEGEAGGRWVGKKGGEAFRPLLQPGEKHRERGKEKGNGTFVNCN